MREGARAAWLCLATQLRVAPALTVLSAMLVAAQYAAAPAGAYGVALMVDGASRSTAVPVTRGTVLLAVAYGCYHLLACVGQAVSGVLDDRVHGAIHNDLLALTAGIPGIAHHEDPDVADRVALMRNRARDMAGGCWQLISAVATVVSTATVVVLLADAQPALLALLPLSAARVWAATAGARQRRNATRRSTPWARRAETLAATAAQAQHGLEVRVLGLRTRLPRLLGTLRERISRERHTAERRATLLELGARAALSLVTVAAIGWLVVLARHGRATPGQVTLLVLLAPQVDRVTGALAGTVRDLADLTHLYEQYLRLRGYAAARAWRSPAGPAPHGLRGGIRLHGVTFRYPGADRAALADVELFLPAGATVALVGDNGAGKTTLLKLLTRMYDPGAGTVMVDGRDLREIDPAMWRSRISATFQDFVKFEFTARESVGIGDLDRLADRSAVTAALRRAGVDTVVSRLPHGLDTQLGTRFEGGTDLSEGQWQRIALARAFLRPAPLLLVLDEPAAALDPLAERELADRLMSGAARQAAGTGAITVVVTHRMSTAQLADLIVLVDQGRIVESGNHAGLLAAGGPYADRYALQAHAYAEPAG